MANRFPKPPKPEIYSPIAYEKDVTKMDRIAKISIKPKVYGITTEGFGEKHVVAIVPDAKWKNIYICDYFISEGIPFSVDESQIDGFESYI